MSPENQFSAVIASLKESAEKPSTNRAPFIGGVFEVAGRITIDIYSYTKDLPSGTRTYTYSYPILTYSDNRAGKVEAFKQTFGGFTLREGKFDSFRWTIKGAKAVEIAASMEAFAPSRSNMIAGFQNWINAESLEERLSTAEELQGTAQTSPVFPSDYEQLVRNPEFMAGVVQARGLVSKSRGEFKYLYVSSTNAALLEAIQSDYGGGITNTTEIGRSLAISRGGAGRLLLNVSPYLLDY